MHHLIATSAARKIRSATTANFSFDASSVARQRIVSGSTTSSTTTTLDSVITSITTAVTDNEFDLSTTVPLNVPVTITNLTPGIATLSGLHATRVSDGTASIILRAGTCGRRVDVSVYRSGTSTTQSFTNFATGSLGRNIVDGVAALLSGKTAPTYGTVPQAGGTVTASSTLTDLFNADGTRNTSGWWGTTDVTCIPQSINQNGVLVTPRDMICTVHYGNGSNPTFRDNSGNTYSRTIVGNTVVGSTDIRVVTLDSDLPASIKPARVLPSTWRTYLPSCQNGYPIVFTNQDRRLLLQETNANVTAPAEMGVRASSDATRSPWYYTIRVYDSGSPAFVLVNGELLLQFTWHYVNSGPPVSDNIAAINTAIYANGSPYSLSSPSLSAFTTF